MGGREKIFFLGGFFGGVFCELFFSFFRNDPMLVCVSWGMFGWGFSRLADFS